MGDVSRNTLISRFFVRIRQRQECHKTGKHQKEYVARMFGNSVGEYFLLAHFVPPSSVS